MALKLFRIFLGLIVALGIVCSILVIRTSSVEAPPSVDAMPVYNVAMKAWDAKILRDLREEELPIEEVEPMVLGSSWECPLSDDDISLIAQLTMAEAEGEPEEGQRLVIDTVLNRMDCHEFPNTPHDVIFQKNQFSCTTDGRFNRCYAKEELKVLVIEELENRYNDQVTYFRTQRYCSYGEPLFKVGHHYFSACRNSCGGV